MFTSNCHFHSTSQHSLSSHNKNIRYFLTIKSNFLHIAINFAIIFLHNQCSRYKSDSKLDIVGKWQIMLSFVCFDVNLKLLRNKFFVHSKYMGKLNLSKRDIFSYEHRKCRSLKDLSQEIFLKCNFIPLPNKFFIQAMHHIIYYSSIQTPRQTFVIAGPFTDIPFLQIRSSKSISYKLAKCKL